jgi:hypothetical protein
MRQDGIGVIAHGLPEEIDHAHGAWQVRFVLHRSTCIHYGSEGSSERVCLCDGDLFSPNVRNRESPPHESHGRTTADTQFHVGTAGRREVADKASNPQHENTNIWASLGNPNQTRSLDGRVVRDDQDRRDDRSLHGLFAGHRTPVRASVLTITS